MKMKNKDLYESNEDNQAPQPTMSKQEGYDYIEYLKEKYSINDFA
jgi:hypothetical protein